jgi:CspA family cold shock protein
MGRGRDRGPKRRGFDDDDYPAPTWGDQPPQRSGPPRREYAAPSGPPVDATVKWFNPEKGFGFAELADGTGDVFLHIAALEAAGHSSVDPGAKLSVQIGAGQKGRQVTAVLAVEAGDGPAPRTGARPSSGRDRPDAATATVEGTIQWYNAQKRFGFAACDDGGKDVFVHASVLERAGIRMLGEGQRVEMAVVKTPKGREAVAITLL